MFIHIETKQPLKFTGGWYIQAGDFTLKRFDLERLARYGHCEYVYTYTNMPPTLILEIEITKIREETREKHYLFGLIKFEEKVDKSYVETSWISEHDIVEVNYCKG